MTAQNQRDPDGTDILGQVRDGLADLKANVISRWGRIPHVAADPTSPPDGAVWIRSDTGNLMWRANGVTYPTAWTGVTYSNSWVDLGGSTQAVQYRKEGDRVWVRGLMKNGTIGLANFTLPVGFRPPSTQRFCIEASNDLGDLTITSAGVVTVADITSNTNVAVEFSFSTIA